MRILSLLLLAFIAQCAVAKADVKSIIEDVRQQMAPDKRQAVYEVEASHPVKGRVSVTGKISDRDTYEALAQKLGSVPNVSYDVTLLPDSIWGLIRLSAACMRTAPKYSSELASQATMGMPVRLLEKSGGWWRIQGPDGYIGWVQAASVAKKTAEQMQQWRAQPRLVVTAFSQIPAYDAPDTSSPRRVVSDLLPGAMVEGCMDSVKYGKVHILLPDGRDAWADAASLTDARTWAAQDFNPDVVLDQAYAMMGAPYLWGGTSPKATDCSGLVKICYLANGYILRRDAGQQAATGVRLAPELWPQYQAGDLLFFAEEPAGNVTHVAIFDADGRFVHCAGEVKSNSLDPQSPDYTGRIFLGATRIHGSEGTEGIVQARFHPWYFTQ